jgi:hypothetical protein
MKNTDAKYGDDEKYEPWADINIFFPIAEQLIDPLHNMGLSPNMVTIISTIFTFMSIYFLHIGERHYAMLSYISGYILDCVDGKMARKHKITSDIGMALDSTSDVISNSALVGYLLITREYTETNIYIFIALGIMSFLLSLSYGLNEAIASYEATGSDDFYKRRLDQLFKNNLEELPIYKCRLYNIFLSIQKVSYRTYRYIFPEYNVDAIDRWLSIIKHFGPGNYCAFVTILLFFI